LDLVSESTTRVKGPLWLENIRYNEKHYGFKETIKVSNHGGKSLVIAAGPSFKKFNQESMEKIVSRRNDLTIIMRVMVRFQFYLNLIASRIMLLQ